jgi:rhodanese-related sulfurtransferase
MDAEHTTTESAARPPEEVAELLAEHPEARVIDVRTSENRDASTTIPGSEGLDVNADIAAGHLAVLLEADLPRDEPIVFVCNSGGKCTIAAEYLRTQGYDAMSIEGGMRAWEASGQAVDEPAAE